MKLNRFLTALITASAASSAAHAVTLGEVHVNSYLGQPLEAEIAIGGLAEGQHQDLRPRIANDEILERMGIVYDPFLRDLRFDVVRSGTQWLVRARSSRPAKEPFLEFPLQLSWTGGNLIRKYTLLLDPPRRVQPARAASVRRTTPAVPTLHVESDEPGADTYGPVRPGETLWPIATQLKPRGITTRQMMLALLRANPEAFIDGDVDKLRAGATLRIPLRAFIEQTDTKTAAVEPATEERPRLTDNLGASPRALERVTDLSADRAEPAPAEAPAIDADDEAAAQADPQDQLRIVTGQEEPERPPEERKQKLNHELLMRLEQLESSLIAANAAAEQVSRLETAVERMKRFIELKDAQIEALQSAAAAAADVAQDAAPQPAPAAAPAKPAIQQGEGPQVASDSRVRAEPATDRSAPAAVRISGDAPLPAAASDNAPWYKAHPWVVWLLACLPWVAVLLLVLRRRRRKSLAEPMAELPKVRPATSPLPSLGTIIVTESAEMEKAEDDFRRLAREGLSLAPDAEVGSAAGDSAQDPGAAAADEPGEILDESKRLDVPTEVNTAPPQINEDDLESWARELGFELEDPGAPSVGQDPLAANDNIELELFDDLDEQTQAPAAVMRAFMAEADGSLGDVDGDARLHGADTEARADGKHPEKEAFSMGLDLARAYLEIGYQEEAKGMLDQALAGAKDPNHRRQIEELLQQIG